MVSRVEEAMKIRQHHKQQAEVKQMIMQCNKGKTNKFKRSNSNVEEDGASAAILLLACIACTTSSHL
ncbi:hypothetical protein RND71_029960 [Anisodus tanguticus]|uniref:Uncharacterized protein n=1 Tax=Anisodus tanguticus TaxID=243964 RepID=A0AAE1V0N3_9SOLA|nr:hypothetical protein RND71_029960 [Anisodus tanguticus]